MPPARREPDRIDRAVVRLEELRATDLGAAFEHALRIVERERAHRALAPALEVLQDAARPEARAALRSRYDDLAADGLRRDQGCSLRTAIVAALRAIDARVDADVAEAALRTVQRVPPSMIDVAQPLRAEGLLLLAESDADCAKYFAVELLSDPNMSTLSGEPALTAIRVLATAGHPLPIWALARRPGLPPDVLAQAFTSIRGAPADLQLAALREHLEAARAAGDDGEAVALVAAEAIVVHRLTDGYPEVVALLRATENSNLYQYLAATAARAGDDAIRAELCALAEALPDRRKRALMLDALGPARRKPN